MQLAARIRAEVLLIDHEAGAARENRATVEQLAQGVEPQLAFGHPRPRMTELRGLLRQGQRRALLLARMRKLDDDVGAAPRQD